MSRKYQKRAINIELIVSLVIVMATTLGSTIPLYVHLSNQTAVTVAAIREDVKTMHVEMKQFHGKLCAIEERNKPL